ncbi:MAG: SIS domain-containing protein [Candidatus Eisenbacteria bacterium]
MSLERMRDWVFELPDQIRIGLERAEARGWPESIRAATSANAHAMFVGGMGGSAVSARLSRALLIDSLRGSVEIGSDPHLPGWVDGETSAGLISYSGETWEVLALWEQLASRGALPWVVSCGGELAERSRSTGAPHLLVPPGYAPRAAFGWLLSSVALALAATGGGDAVPSVRSQLGEAAAALAEEREFWRKGSAGAAGRDPEALASALAGRRVLVLVARESDLALAYRWKNQFEENAKQVTQVVAFPEAGHNEIEGWARLGGGEVVFLETPARAGEPARVARGRDAALEAVLDVARQAGLGVHRVPTAPGSRWTGFLSQVFLADFVSIRMAEQRGIDPEPVPVLGSIKDAVRRHLDPGA